MARKRGDVKWVRPPEQVANDLQAWAAVEIYSRAERRAEALALDIENWMMANRVWNDRTTDARYSLMVSVTKEGHNIELVLSHGVPYGIWLEVMQGGRFSILVPATQYWGPQLTQRMLKK